MLLLLQAFTITADYQEKVERHVSCRRLAAGEVGVTCVLVDIAWFRLPASGWCVKGCILLPEMTDPSPSLVDDGLA